jgi:TRAP-type C4-dicarboxylate transport system permease large subunit
MSYLVALAFLAILSSLAAALFFMMRGDKPQDNSQKSQRMARALALRVAFSVLLFVCILVSWKMGWVNPTGIPPGR